MMPILAEISLDFPMEHLPSAAFALLVLITGTLLQRQLAQFEERQNRCNEHAEQLDADLSDLRLALVAAGITIPTQSSTVSRRSKRD